MSQPGSYKIPSRNRAFEAVLDPALRSARRIQRILDSLRAEIESEGGVVRARRIFEQPREVFRLEIENRELGYQRTTLLDRDALDELLASRQVRERLHLSLD